MSKGKIPHVHAEVLKVWLDDTTTQIQWRQREDDKWEDCISPNWYADFQYRLKPKPKYPKSTLDYERAWTIYTSYRGLKCDGEANLEVAHAAVAEFIESGEMVKYFTNPDNGYITLTENI